MLPRINMVAEQYPDLKADTSFVNLQNQLVALENQLADRREFYNASATNFNAAIQMIPTNFVAGMKGCVRRELFVVEGVQRVRTFRFPSEYEHSSLNRLIHNRGASNVLGDWSQRYRRSTGEMVL